MKKKREKEILPSFVQHFTISLNTKCQFDMTIFTSNQKDIVHVSLQNNKRNTKKTEGWKKIWEWGGGIDGGDLLGWGGRVDIFPEMSLCSEFQIPTDGATFDETHFPVCTGFTNPEWVTRSPKSDRVHKYLFCYAMGSLWSQRIHFDLHARITPISISPWGYDNTEVCSWLGMHA